MCMFLSSLHCMMCSLPAAGALACFEVDQTKTIYQAVVDENWGTARELLCAEFKGKLSGSA